MWERIGKVTRSLAALGVAEGERIAFLGYNNPDMLALLFASARVGAILVPLNWRLAAREHQIMLEDCNPQWLFYEPEFESHSRQLAWPRQPIHGPWLDSDAAPAILGTDQHDVLIVYTSGTTGVPKGAVLTQNALLWNGFNSMHAHDLRQSDHVLSALPMFHVGGLNNQTLPALQAGAMVTLHRRFAPGAWLADVSARKPSLSLLVPATIAAVIHHPDWPAADLSSLRMLNTGSSVVPESLIRAFHARGVPVGQIYGSTETAPIATVLLREDAESHVGSAGKPAPHCEVRIVDRVGRDLPDETVGELWVRGPNVMRTYWNNPAATRAAFHDGWFKTGDLARRDRHGYFWVAGRSNDLIISGGENIYPAELENVLADCPAIAEYAVIGIADAKWGEAACACVVKRPGEALDEDGVRALFIDRLAKFKHPRRVAFLDHLPKSALGKVQKFELKQLVERGAASEHGNQGSPVTPS